MVIDSTDIRKLKNYATQYALPRLVDHMVRSDGGKAPNLDLLYVRAVETFIGHVLAERMGTASDTSHGMLAELSAEMGGQCQSIAADDIGRLYEHLRGFRLSPGHHGTPELIPSLSGKRNQGLFYTPPRIVRFIVTQVLDALQPADPMEYFHMKILDPAVGAGVFLSGVLEEIIHRVATGRLSTWPTPLPLSEDRHVGSTAPNTGISCDCMENAAPVSCLQKCLYGVDLDATAVQIARARLAEMVDPRLFAEPEAFPHVKAGNALMGIVGPSPGGLNRSACHTAQARSFFGRTMPEPDEIARWARAKSLFHWPLEFPEVFSEGRGGFDAVVGNPPYEILSAKESGIEARRMEQAYFRKTFATCKGKINTYRLMIERGLDLLRVDGVLGFIVPATLLADSTSAPLREMILDGSRVLSAVVIPEKARVFDGVTQALLILILRKGGSTGHIAPAYWDGTGEIPPNGGLEISRAVVRHCDGRIPLVRSDRERKLLESLARHPPLGGDAETPRAGKVHQGEINLTTHRSLITDAPTGLPLIRGEHVYPFRLAHPTPGKKRLDWLLPDALAMGRTPQSLTKGDLTVPVMVPNVAGSRGTPWEETRIGLGRVVNMGTKRRLKAALVPRGCYLSDMTNFIKDFSVPLQYVLALLNSSLLNWRFKVTSTNNYLSAREIELLPIVRPPGHTPSQQFETKGLEFLDRLVNDPPSSIAGSLSILREELQLVSEPLRSAALISMITGLGERLTSMNGARSHSETDALLPLLDGLVLTLYRVEELADVVSPEP